MQKDVLVTSVGHVIPNVGLVKLPAYLYRDNIGRRWIVRCPHLKVSRSFMDSKTGGCTNGFYRAVAYHRIKIGTTRIHDVPAPKRKHCQTVQVTEVAGINFSPYEAPSENKLGYFVIHCMAGVREGMSMLPGEGYHEALERAKEIRDIAIAHYNRYYRWKGWNPDLYKGLLK